MTDVAVVIPTHNRATNMPRLLDALAAQTLDRSRFEIVIVDDCSTDGTTGVVDDRVASGDLPLRLLRTPVNTAGPAAPRNLGWRATSAPVVAFLDDDCTPDPGWLEQGLLAMAAAPDLGVVQGRVEVPPGTEIALLDRWSIWRRVDGPSPWFECANIFYARAALEATGGFDEGLVTWGEDTDLGWRVLGAGFERGFASNSVAIHDVENRGWRTAARFGWKDTQLVELAARYPALRTEGFWRPWAIHRQGAEFVFAIAGVVLARWWRPAAMLAIPYMWFRRPPIRRPGTIRIGSQTVLVDSIRLAARLRGSWRAGVLVI